MICLLPVVPCRISPSDRSEMISQLLFGELITVLDQNEKWLLIKSDIDNYESWVDKKQLVLIPNEHVTAVSESISNNKVNALFSTVRVNAGLLTIPFGSFVFEQPLVLPGFSIESSHRGSSSSTFAEEAIKLLGAPYLWGGKTPMGYDCSGFVQTVLSVCGQSIHRDSSQQAEVGETVTFTDEAREGDLAFFDNDQGKITHVGLLIHHSSNKSLSIIHASGEVRVDQFDHLGIFNKTAGTYTHKLRIIKRIRS